MLFILGVKSKISVICTDVNTEIQDLEKLSSLDGVMGACFCVLYFLDFLLSRSLIMAH